MNKTDQIEILPSEYLDLEGKTGKEIIYISPNQIKTDSRKIRENDLFLALSGENFDGHHFIEKAIEAGASIIVYKGSKWDPSRLKTRNGKKPVFFVPTTSPLKFYQTLANRWRKMLSSSTVIAITGSYGKTTVKEMLDHVLSEFGKVHKTFANENNDIGVAKTLLETPKDAKFCILEMGARHPGDIAPLVKFSAPEICILTGIKDAHIEIFGNYENLCRTKLEMFTSSQVGALKIGSIDHVETKEALARCPNTVTISQADTASIKINPLQPNSKKYVYTVGQNKVEFDWTLHSDVFLYNSAFVLAVVFGLGLDLSKAGDLLSKYPGTNGRFYIHQQANRILIDDSYNAGPQSMLAGLTVLRQNFDGDPVLVLGEMLELGAESRKAHQNLGNFLNIQFKNSTVILIGHDMKYAYSEIENTTKVKLYEDIDGLQNDPIWNELKDADKDIYLKGSHNTKIYKLVKKLLKT